MAHSLGYWASRGGRRLGAAAWTAAPWLALVAIAGLWARAPRPVPVPPPAGRKVHAPGMSLQPGVSPRHIAAAEPGRGRLAASPRQIPARGWRDVLWRTVKEVEEDRLTIVAGGVTFYALLALFPSVGVFVSLYGLFADVGEVNRQLIQLSAMLPAEALSLVGDQMMRLAGENQESLSLAFVISLLLSVWSANAGMKALFAGLNVAYDEAERRNFFLMTAVTYGFTLGALLFVTIVSAVLVAVPLVLEQAGLVGGLLAPLRWLLLWAVAAGAFSIAYRYGPCRARARWRWVSWGAVFSSTLWLAGSLGFSWYVNNIARFDITYGPLGAVIGFMMWIWFSVMVILIGAELNAEIEHQTTRDSTTGPPEPMGERGAAMADTVGVKFDPDFGGLLSRLRGRKAAQPPPSSTALKPSR